MSSDCAPSNDSPRRSRPTHQVAARRQKMRASAKTCIVLVTGPLASRPMSLRLADALPDGEPQLDQATPQRGERAGHGGLQGVELPGRRVWLGEKWEDRRRTGALPIECVAVVGQQLL